MCWIRSFQGINTVRFDITPQQPIGNVPNTRLRVLVGNSRKPSDLFDVAFLQVRSNMPRHHQGLWSSSDVTCSDVAILDVEPCVSTTELIMVMVTYGNTLSRFGFSTYWASGMRVHRLGLAGSSEMLCRRCIVVCRIMFQTWALEQTFWWTCAAYRITHRACRKSLILLHLRCTSRLLHLYWVHWDHTGPAYFRWNDTLCDQVQTPTPSNLSLVSLVGSLSLPSGPQLYGGVWKMMELLMFQGAIQGGTQYSFQLQAQMCYDMLQPLRDQECGRRMDQMLQCNPPYQSHPSIHQFCHYDIRFSVAQEAVPPESIHW